jgi:hypothetical protein
MISRELFYLALGATMVCRAQVYSQQENEVSLFNGRDLTGWHGDPNLWRVENGAIVGEARPGVISYLSSVRTHEDFILHLKFKLISGNSGIQVRSREHDGYKMSGPQVDIQPDPNWLGLVYNDRGKGTVMQHPNRDEAGNHYRPNDWNEYVITYYGSRITVKLNGHYIMDYEDQSGQVDRAGVIGLQLFAPVQAASVQFKDITIKELRYTARAKN